MGMKEYFEGNLFRNVLLALIVLILLVTMFHSFAKGEKFAPSYSAGADQRFQQINTDPTLGKQFGPYNDEIEARIALLGRERLASDREPPVVYNFGRSNTDFKSPPLGIPGAPAAMRAAEAGLSNMGDSGMNGEGTPQDGDVEELMAELYG
jgi:hypothetical protein